MQVLKFDKIKVSKNRLLVLNYTTHPFAGFRRGNFDRLLFSNLKSHVFATQSRDVSRPSKFLSIRVTIFATNLRF